MTIKLIYSKMYIDEENSYNKRDTFNIEVLDVLLSNNFSKENTVSELDSVFSFKISPF